MARGKQSTRKTCKTEKVHQLIALALDTTPPVVHQKQPKTTVIDMKYSNMMFENFHNLFPPTPYMTNGSSDDDIEVEAITGLEGEKDKVKDNLTIGKNESI